MAVQARNGFLPSRRHHGHTHHQPPAGDDEWWEYFPCPFCYIEVEVPFLCDHLQDEHCFDMKNAVCPICADNLGTDSTAHFRDQHSQLLKRRKWSSSKQRGAAADDDETCEEEDDSCFETTSCITGTPVDDHSPDPLLSRFICSVAPPPVDSEPGDAEGEDHAPPSLDDQRLDRVEMDDASRQDLEERLRRAEFVKQMLMSTIARD